MLKCMRRRIQPSQRRTYDVDKLGHFGLASQVALLPGDAAEHSRVVWRWGALFVGGTVAVKAADVAAYFTAHRAIRLTVRLELANAARAIGWRRARDSGRTGDAFDAVLNDVVQRWPRIIYRARGAGSALGGSAAAHRAVVVGRNGRPNAVVRPARVVDGAAGACLAAAWTVRANEPSVLCSNLLERARRSSGAFAIGAARIDAPLGAPNAAEVGA